ncbi:MAG: polysaccharide biosynthesis/export family protein [Planctomycetota bacterium]
MIRKYGRVAGAGMVLVVVGLIALGATGCSSVDYNNINDAVLATGNVRRRLEVINGRYILGAMDAIRVKVANGPGLSGGHTIRPDGYITLDLVGDVYVEGMTPMTAADALARALRVYIRDVDVTVWVTGFNSKQYFMFGETPGKGAKPFTGDVTVLAAFARAGGVTNRAAWDRIRLVRATRTNRQIFKINLGEIVKQGQWDTNVQVKANDVIYVPPTHMAKVGYFLDNLLFPFRSVLGAMSTVRSVGGGGL